jgi:hypothetical protein
LSANSPYTLFLQQKTPALRSLVCPKADTLEPPVLRRMGLLFAPERLVPLRATGSESVSALDRPDRTGRERFAKKVNGEMSICVGQARPHRSGEIRQESKWRNLEYFKNEMIRLHEAGELSDNEWVDLKGFVNNIITHITDGNENERLVAVMGGELFETESERLMRIGREEGVARLNRLYTILNDQGRDDDLIRALRNQEYRQKLLDELVPVEEIEQEMFV